MNTIGTSSLLDFDRADVSQQIMLFARHCLSESLGVPSDLETTVFEQLSCMLPIKRLNVTLRTHGRLRGSMSHEGSSLAAQIRSATIQAARDVRFGSRVAAIELPSIDVEIWLQRGSSKVEAEEIAAGNCFALGVEGVEISADGKSAYYKPSVAITSGKKTIPALMTSLCRKAGLPDDRWTQPEATIERTQWQSITSVLGAVRSSHVISNSLPAKAELVLWLRESVSYLLNSRQADGDFTYHYDPINDREVFQPQSRVRSAGCLYALSSFLDSECAIGQSGCVDQISQIAKCQVDLTVDFLNIGRIVPERDRTRAPKMGASALLALALGGASLRHRFDSAYQALSRSIDASQLSNHRFLTHFGVDEEDVRSSEFFSGQALLTLAQRAARGDHEALQRASAAFETYRDQFISTPTSAFAGWHVDLWTRMATLADRDDFAEFAFYQVDWLLGMQITKSNQATWIGGFSASGEFPKFSSIVFLEATVRAYLTARHLGLTERKQRYGEAIRLGIRFCSLLRIQEQQRTWFPNPDRCRGGVSLSPLDKVVRCDVPQHFITLCLCLLEAPELLQDG